MIWKRKLYKDTMNCFIVIEFFNYVKKFFLSYSFRQCNIVGKNIAFRTVFVLTAHIGLACRIFANYDN